MKKYCPVLPTLAKKSQLTQGLIKVTLLLGTAASSDWLAQQRNICPPSMGAY